MSKRLDKEVLKHWILHLTTKGLRTEPPKWETLVTFLEEHVATLESLENSGKEAIVPNKGAKPGQEGSFTVRAHVASGSNDKCLLCSKDHFFLYCEGYKKKNGQNLYHHKKDAIVAWVSILLEIAIPKRLA